jgi:hypothetical protein
MISSSSCCGPELCRLWLIPSPVYAIEATCHAPSFEGIYGEIYKCLKPGGIVSIHTPSSFSLT